MADNSILNRLDGLKLKYEETGQKLTDPEVIADVKQFVQLTKEYKELEPIIETSERYRTALANLAEAKDTYANDKDEEMREMAREMIAELEPQIAELEEQIKLLLIPKDPQDSKNAIVEIRGGTGGDEAALFAGDLLRMYTKYIESKGWRYEITSSSDGAAGGFKEVVLLVEGKSGEAAQLEEMLAAAGMRCEVVAPAYLAASAEALMAYDAIALVNVNASAIGEDQLAALTSYVRTLGRGLCVFGGDDSFAPGGYRGSALEEILPVTADVRNQADLPSLALLLVIDKSGSMADDAGATRLEMAKEAACRRGR